MSLESEPDPNVQIRTHVTNGGGDQWQYGPVARDLYQAADLFEFYFFRPRTPDQLTLPPLLLAFAPDDIRTLAHYKLKENPNGLRSEILFNTKWIARPPWEIYETLLHEQAHLFQESMFERGVEGFTSCRGGYHNKQFVAICEEMGLHPRLGHGSHWKPADGQFAKLMDRNFVAPPAPVEVPDDQPKADWWDLGGPTKKGSSPLVLYTAEGCPRSPNICKIRAGRRDLELGCITCGGVFQPR